MMRRNKAGFFFAMPSSEASSLLMNWRMAVFCSGVCLFFLPLGLPAPVPNPLMPVLGPGLRIWVSS